MDSDKESSISGCDATYEGVKEYGLALLASDRIDQESMARILPENSDLASFWEDVLSRNDLEMIVKSGDHGLGMIRTNVTFGNVGDVEWRISMHDWNGHGVEDVDRESGGMGEKPHGHVNGLWRRVRLGEYREAQYQKLDKEADTTEMNSDDVFDMNEFLYVPSKDGGVGSMERVGEARILRVKNELYTPDEEIAYMGPDAIHSIDFVEPGTLSLVCRFIGLDRAERGRSAHVFSSNSEEKAFDGMDHRLDKTKDHLERVIQRLRGE